MLERYLLYRRTVPEKDGPPPLPPGVLFFCDFGCATWALLDCRHPSGRMWWWAQGVRYRLGLTLPEWFEAWLAGYDLFGCAEAREPDGDGCWGDVDDDWPRTGIPPHQATLW